MALDVLSSNALRDSARRAVTEITTEWNRQGIQGDPKKQGARDKIARVVIRRIADELHPRFTLVQLVYMIGVVRGVLEDRS